MESAKAPKRNKPPQHDVELMLSMFLMPNPPICPICNQELRFINKGKWHCWGGGDRWDIYTHKKWSVSTKKIPDRDAQLIIELVSKAKKKSAKKTRRERVKSLESPTGQGADG